MFVMPEVVRDHRSLELVIRVDVRILRKRYKCIFDANRPIDR